MAHISAERNRRRQMNEHLKVLRSLTPCLYIKRAATEGGDVSELVQLLPGLTLLNSPGDQASIIGGVIEFIKELHQVVQSLEAQKKRKRLSPSPGLISPKPLGLSPREVPDGDTNFKEFGASCKSPIVDVEAKISGSNVLLRTISRRIPGQVVRIIHALENLSFEILQLNISSMEDTVLYSFVIKIGLECQVSVEELTLEVQKVFCPEAAAN